MYYNARYYDPQIGHFISPDTIVPSSGSVLAYNRYMYTYGNPIKYNDPTGHCPPCVLVAAAVGSKVLDYGWTAWDTFEAGRTLNNPNASRNDKLLAGLNIALAAVTEVVEPDDLLPVGLPADDLARRAMMNGAREALEAGGESRLRAWIKDNLGEGGEAVLNKLDELIPCAVNSFSADTLVMTASGSKPISELVIGDIVLAYNEATRQIEPHEITDTISHIDPEIVLLTIDGELLETTDEHPFYVMDSAPWLSVGQTAGRWVDAGELSIGNNIWRADGSTGEVESVEVAAVQQRMYNLTVDTAHTFFVGQGQWLVHNCDGPQWTKKLLSQSEVIAKGSKGRNKIRDIKRLVEEYGGNAKNWVKKKSFDENGIEWHWYEHPDIGRVESKIKNYE